LIQDLPAPHACHRAPGPRGPGAMLAATSRGL